MSLASQYHAHIYFKPDQFAQAAAIREAISNRFLVAAGKMHSTPIGPHSRGMFQVIFSSSQFGQIVPWLMFQRQSLSILVHPDTGEHLIDHTDRALWLGEQLLINTGVF